jgi:hypothetical protein
MPVEWMARATRAGAGDVPVNEFTGWVAANLLKQVGGDVGRYANPPPRGVLAGS